MRPIAFLAALVAALSLQASAAGAAPATSDWMWPVHGDVVTPYRNSDDPYAGGQHRGIDIAAAVGTPVVAATGGSVTFAGVAGDSGLTVSVRTADGRYDVSYLHLSAAAVHKGDAVDRGARVGAVGTSGTRSVAQSHLHFGVRDAGARHAYHDPRDFLPPLTPPAPPPEPPAPAPVQAPAPAPPAAAVPTAAPVDATPAAEPSAPLGAAAGQAAAAPAGVAAVTPAAPTPADRRARGDRSAHGLAFEHTGARHGIAARTRRTAAVVASRPAASARRATPGASPHTPGRITRSSSRAPDTRGGTTSAPAAQTAGGGAVAPAATLKQAAHPAPPGGRARGIDIGWLAALIGLVVAAICLGRPDLPAQATRAGRARLSALLRPLGGGR